MTPRERLIVFLRQTCPDFHDWRDDAPLVGSGLIDSLLLMQLAIWVEGETGNSLDPASFDLAREWSTIGSVLSFIDQQTAGKAR